MIWSLYFKEEKSLPQTHQQGSRKALMAVQTKAEDDLDWQTQDGPLQGNIKLDVIASSLGFEDDEAA
jgi:hypothetical protein